MHYDKYGSVLVVGAGIGMTPCASVLTAMLKYRWRAGFKPEILHFYWVVAHGDVPAFEWFVHRVADRAEVADLEYDLYRGREAGAVANRCYCEINVYVTRAPRPGHGAPAAMRPPRDEPGALPRVFTARQLFDELLSPAVSSKDQAAAMAAAARRRTGSTRGSGTAGPSGTRSSRRRGPAPQTSASASAARPSSARTSTACASSSSTHDDASSRSTRRT
ncbi:oxidoreductase [Aureococcus anophagefferens]|nr:oxidoreductase [Aureococcus anophagefferens]